MADSSKLDDLINKKDVLENDLIQLRGLALDTLEKITQKELEISNNDNAIQELLNPKNPVLKVFSRVGTKASNVIKNVRLSVMSEDDLKNEYQIYKRVNDTLGKESVPFETFKETPEDFVSPSNKPSHFKKVEDMMGKGGTDLSKVLQQVIHSTNETIQQITKNAEEPLNHVAQAQEKLNEIVPSLKEKLTNGFFNLGKHAGDIIKTAKDTYTKAAQEVDSEMQASTTTNEVQKTQTVQGADTSSTEKKQAKPNLTGHTSEEKDVTPDIKVEEVVVEKTVKKRVPAKKAAKPKLGKKEQASEDLKKSRVLACRKVFKSYKEVIDKNTDPAVKPVYLYLDYVAFVENNNTPKEHQLNAVSFSKAVKALESVQNKKANETVIEDAPVAPATRRKSP